MLWVLLLLYVPLAVVMGLLGLTATVVFIGLEPGLNVLGNEPVQFLTNSQVAVLPLFLMMGSLAVVAGMSGDIYELAHTLLSHRRGGLALATIGGCAGFGALTGSSLATVATIGRVALPEMGARGYSTALATGCVAAGGTLGALVPPSIPLIFYALLTEQSIGALFVAAVVPAAIAVRVLSRRDRDFGAAHSGLGAGAQRARRSARYPARIQTGLGSAAAARRGGRQHLHRHLHRNRSGRDRHRRRFHLRPGARPHHPRDASSR